MIGDGAIDQTKLPWCTAYGAEPESYVSAAELEAWSTARAKRCGHAAPVDTCRMCQGTMRVTVLVGVAGKVRVFGSW